MGRCSPVATAKTTYSRFYRRAAAPTASCRADLSRTVTVVAAFSGATTHSDSNSLCRFGWGRAACAARDPLRSQAGTSWQTYDIQPAIAPPAIRQLDRYLPEAGRVQEHLQWFNPYIYREASRSTLNLADGAKGERALARLALFQWLSQTNGLLPVLIEHVKQLAKFHAEDGTRQIVIIGAADGGVSGGWFIDLARLFQRIARAQENLEALPDVIGVLCQQRDRRHPANEKALVLELETAQAARKFPQRVAFVPDDELLDQTDTHSPYHWRFSVNAVD